MVHIRLVVIHLALILGACTGIQTPSSTDSTDAQINSSEGNVSSSSVVESSQNQSYSSDSDSSLEHMSSSDTIQAQSSNKMSLSFEIENNSSVSHTSSMSVVAESSESIANSSSSGVSIIYELQEWFKQVPQSRTPLNNESFATKAMTEEEASQALNLLMADKQAAVAEAYDAQWENRLLNIDGHEMPFYYQTFGEKPDEGRSLFISMHGGGGTTAATNDQQYQNQKHLYDATMETLEGVYLAPRAPTNEWNLWHQNHIDDFFNVIIQMAIIKEGVNPNKVYVLGYSAGGDGVYQLAPRMADRWAAASMMAGHPNEASPLGLRNLPFAIHVGSLDDGYDRNVVAEQWGQKLDSLQEQDSEGYIHDVQLHQGYGHWMELTDAVALSWMAQYDRNAIPTKILWKQDDRKHTSFYWLKVSEEFIHTNDKIEITYNSALNEIDILNNDYEEVQITLNDLMMDLDEPVTVKYQGVEIFNGVIVRTVLNQYESIAHKNDGSLAFSAVVTVTNNQTVVVK
ncbi:MAG: hypothetical protein OCD76_15200 [Reichenbachiella sp.]